MVLFALCGKPLPAGMLYLSRRRSLIHEKRTSPCFIFLLLSILLMLTGENGKGKTICYAHITKGRSQTREKRSIHESSSGRLQMVMYGRDNETLAVGEKVGGSGESPACACERSVTNVIVRSGGQRSEGNETPVGSSQPLYMPRPDRGEAGREVTRSSVGERMIHSGDRRVVGRLCLQ